MRIKQLKEERSALEAKLNGFLTSERSLTKEDGNAVDSILAQLEDIKQAEEREARMAAYAFSNADGRVATQSENHAIENNVENLRHYMLTGEQRANVSDTTDSAGKYAVPSELQNGIVDYMKQTADVLNWVTTINTSGGHLMDINRTNDLTNSAEWSAQATQLSSMDIVLDNVSLSAYTLKNLVTPSIEMLQDAGYDFAGEISRLIGYRFGRALENAYTVGDGSGKPTGFLTGITAGKTAAAATAFTRDELVDVIHSIDPAYRSSPKFAMIMHDSTLAYIRKLAFGSADDRPLYQGGDARTGAPTMVEGVPVIIDNSMPEIASGEDVIAVGDFSRYYGRQVGGFQLRRLDERFADSLLVGFLAYSRHDGVLVDPTAIKSLQMA
ncbi:MAG: phage major capsid protein [Flavobacteriales bacterium]|nr:phage major capsid protein [Flavobacteriales bacterium]